MSEFEITPPLIIDPLEIERLSLQQIEKEASIYPAYKSFSDPEQRIIQRMIHATTAFDNIISNIMFTPKVIEKIKNLISSEAVIITDTNMIKTGLNNNLLDKHNNKVICLVGDSEIADLAKKEGTTRTVAAIKTALKLHNSSPKILACGNAPTFLYAMIEYIIKNKMNTNDLALIVMPVGFINVVESKKYTMDFMKHKNIEGIVLDGRYGGSTLVVSCLHAIYKLL
jgi:precorrin-8X/cobalt-precorrin-8 methylmutase